VSLKNHLIYESKTHDYKQEIPLLKDFYSRYILKAKSGEIKISVNNALDKNVGITQQANINYFARTVSNSLGRYLMIAFIHSINKHRERYDACYSLVRKPGLNLALDV
jgi:hypothetical protein